MPRWTCPFGPYNSILKVPPVPNPFLFFVDYFPPKRDCPLFRIDDFSFGVGAFEKKE
jgi:hypothetical protein